MRLVRKITADWSELSSHPGFQQHPWRVLSRAAAWSLMCLLRLPVRARFSQLGFYLYLTPQWRHGGGTAPYLFREAYAHDLPILTQCLRPGMVFVDAGANTGVYTFTAASLVGPSGCVLAYEPGATCFHGLMRSLELNDFANVRIRRQALSDCCTAARLYHHEGQENSFGLAPGDGADYEEIETQTLEQALRIEQLSRVDFIKLDVQGAQELVIRGSRELLERCLPAMLIEIDRLSAAKMNLDPEGSLGLLREMGYELFVVQSSGALVPIGPVRRGRRVLAVHPDGVAAETLVAGRSLAGCAGG